MSYITTFFEAIINIFNEMSPYLLLGFLIAGIMHAFVPNGWYSKYLSGNNFRSVFNAALFGIPLPLCSCGVIPTAMSLRREGASKSSVISFLIATPQTGVDSIFATYSLMGLPFAIVRPIAALVTAVLGGVFVGHNLKDEDKNDATQKAHEQSRNFSEHEQLSFIQRVKGALRFAFIEMMEDIGKWLVVGLIIAGLITALVPDSWFAIFRDNTLMSMLLVLSISIPMYVCATGSIPIAVALMIKGLTPGSALVLLMAGPAANAASILVINKVLGRRTLVLYLIAITVGALAFGCGIDLLLPREWFTQTLVEMKACCHEEAGWFSWLCSGTLLLLLLNVLRMHFMHQETCSCGHCHDNHHEHCHCENEHEHCHCENKHEHCHCENDNDQDCQTLVFNVKGMTCNHCRTNVEKAILSVSGVERAVVDLHSGKAEVVGDDLDSAAICNAVENIGFEIE